jgi:hypothetical protein
MIRGLGISVLLVGSTLGWAAQAQGAPPEEGQPGTHDGSPAHVAFPGGLLLQIDGAAGERLQAGEAPPAEAPPAEAPAAPPAAEEAPPADAPAADAPAADAPAADAPAADAPAADAPAADAPAADAPAADAPAADAPAADAPAAEEPDDDDEGFQPVAPAAAAPAAAAPADEEVAELEYPGYVPGYKRFASLGLSPHATKQRTSMAGGITPAFGAPTDPGSFRFDFNGSLYARFQFGVGERVRDGGGSIGFHIPPRETNTYVNQGAGATLNFRYASPYVEAFVGYSSGLTGKTYTGQYQPPTRSGINQAYANFILPELGDWIAQIRIGGFTDSYGGAGRWGWGIFGPLVSVKGYGERLSGSYELNTDWEFEFGQGFAGLPAKDEAFPRGAYVGDWNAAGLAAFVHHYHLGMIYDATYTLRAHYVSAFAAETRTSLAWTQGEEGQGGPSSIALDLDAPPAKDGSYDIYIAEGHIEHEYYGHLGLATSYNKVTNGTPVRSGIWWDFGWTNGAEAISGMIGAPTGAVGVVSAEYNLSLRSAIDQDFYDPEASDLRLNVAVHNYWVAETENLEQKDLERVYYAAELEYRWLKWLSASLTWRYNNPDTRVETDNEWFLSPSLTFRSDWDSADRITLSYRKYFRPDTFVDNPNMPVDPHVFELYATVSW